MLLQLQKNSYPYLLQVPPKAGYNRINVFFKIFKIAKGLDYKPEDADNKYYCFLVFVYDITSPNKRPIVYSSINRALKGLQISHSTLLDYINNKYIFKTNLVLSFESLVEEDFFEYQEKPTGDSQLRKHVIVYSQENEVVAEFKSGREMARYFQIDGKVVRAAIAKAFLPLCKSRVRRLRRHLRLALTGLKER